MQTWDMRASRGFCRAQSNSNRHVQAVLIQAPLTEMNTPAKAEVVLHSAVTQETFAFLLWFPTNRELAGPDQRSFALCRKSSRLK